MSTIYCYYDNIFPNREIIMINVITTNEMTIDNRIQRHTQQ